MNLVLNHFPTNIISHNDNNIRLCCPLPPTQTIQEVQSYNSPAGHPVLDSDMCGVRPNPTHRYSWSLPDDLVL